MTADPGEPPVGASAGEAGEAGAVGGGADAKLPVSLRVNGRGHPVWVSPADSLLDVLHDGLGFGDVRYGCGEGVCGTCTVLCDGAPLSSCLVFAVQMEDLSLITLTGLARLAGDEDAMHPIQECFLEAGGLQCGFCTPGMILTAYSLVERLGRPSREEIRYELEGNLCRCTGYAKILDAVEDYAGRRTS